MRVNGAEILIRTLIDHDVKTIFGYPGGAVLNIYDALYKHSEEINHIIVAHEQGAAHAADGYARATGKVGVCLATSGPGATNLVTGIATAYMDSVPLVVITGNVAKPLIGKDSFQEVDIVGITMPITKHNFIVRDVNELQHTIRKAFRIANEGRKGPVLIDIPKDVTAEMAEYVKKEPQKLKESNDVDEEKLDQVANLINESKQVFIYAGGGIISGDASEELLALAEKINSPVGMTLMGLGGFPDKHPLFTGMIGMHGSRCSNICATQCDLLIAIGARFSDRVINNKNFIKNAKVIHLDIDEAEINKNVKVDLSLVGNIKVILEKLLPKLKENRNEQWMAKLQELKEADKCVCENKGELNPQIIVTQIKEAVKEQGIIVTDVGQHQMWTAQYYGYDAPRTFISSGGLGTMGFGMGAAIGAQVGMPNKRVVLVTGDGSFGMNCNEMVTAVSQNLPMIIIIMNNSVLGMVRQWQKLFYEERYSSTTLNRKTDFVKLAEAYGATAFRAYTAEELQDCLSKAVDYNSPVLIDCVVDMDKKVFPMVAPGAPISEILLEKDL